MEVQGEIAARSSGKVVEEGIEETDVMRAVEGENLADTKKVCPAMGKIQLSHCAQWQDNCAWSPLNA